MFFRSGKKPTAEERAAQTLRVDPHRCPQNHPCPSVKVCPVGALSQKGFSAPTVDGSVCVKCGKCVKFCPMRALKLV